MGRYSIDQDKTIQERLNSLTVQPAFISVLQGYTAVSRHLGALQKDKGCSLTEAFTFYLNKLGLESIAKKTECEARQTAQIRPLIALNIIISLEVQVKAARLSTFSKVDENKHLDAELARMQKLVVDFNRYNSPSGKNRERLKNIIKDYNLHEKPDDKIRSVRKFWEKCFDQGYLRSTEFCRKEKINPININNVVREKSAEFADFMLQFHISRQTIVNIRKQKKLMNDLKNENNDSFNDLLVNNYTLSLDRAIDNIKQVHPHESDMSDNKVVTSVTKRVSFTKPENLVQTKLFYKYDMLTPVAETEPQQIEISSRSTTPVVV